MKNCLFINNKWMIGCSLLAMAYAGDVMAMYGSESNVSRSSSNLVSSSNDSSQRNKIAQNRVREMSTDEYEQWISAAKEGNYALIESFIKKGVNVNQVQGVESPALLYAAACGYIEIVKLLVENGADVNLKDDDGDTPLENAVGNIEPEVVEYLLRKNADAKVKNKEGITPLMRFLESFRIKRTGSEDLKKIAKLLVDFGADVNEHGIGEEKYSLLTYALRFIKNPQDLVIYLVEHGADIGYEDQDKLLIKWFDDGNLEGTYKEGLIGTPLEIAKAQGYTEIVDYLNLMERNKIFPQTKNKNNRKDDNNEGEEN
ncbi:MAG: ankyrin repeat domain-containing protein [Alphaproteobacteria bacterium]|nr:ankyrin repeat domain-containing protein [Alphaproteobacteria bacterium]